MEEQTFTQLLDRFRKSGIPEAINYEQMNEILISHHSTAIEGSSLTEEETRLLLTEGITAKGKPLYDHNMVRDHHRALLHIIETANKKQPVSAAMIRELSSMVMKTTGGIIHAAAGTYDSSKGDFRLSMVTVGARYFPNYQKVPGEVDKLCTKINAQLNPPQSTPQIYNQAFDAHFDLVSIHPFADGNGRVSRLLMNYILSYHRQPLAILFNEDKSDYYNALETSREQEDRQPFRDFMLSQQIKYIKRELKSVE
jgi:Fic family protein